MVILGLGGAGCELFVGLFGWWVVWSAVCFVAFDEPEKWGHLLTTLVGAVSQSQ